jgi:hypothetical protein
MGGGKIGEFMNLVKNYLEIAKSNKSTLENSSETQLPDAIKNTLKSTKEHLNSLLSSAQEMLKIGEDMLEEFIKQEKEVQQDEEMAGTHLKENSKTREEGARKDLNEIKANKQVLINFQVKLTEMEQLGAGEQIKVVKEV